jgi:UDP-N-acetylmuramoyl-L-alanyl-D-glutamate--2,6-diaminopimelate ligase
MAALQRLMSADEAVQWLRARGVTGPSGLVTDSRALKAGDAFVAWPGWATDGRRFVRDALAAGAAACLVEDEGVEAHRFDDPRIATLAGLKAATGAIADLWFQRPSAALDVVAVTGTNGKTSSACWIAEALVRAGQRAGIVGTLGIGEPGALVATGLTTPDPVTLQRALRGFVDRGLTACAMEASSIGLVEQRLAGTRIGVAVFTNFTRDHLDYHGTMEAYWAAKRRLFDWPGLRAAVVNVDDPQGAALAAELRGSGLDLWTVSRAAPARLAGSALRYGARGLVFDVHDGDSLATLETALVGDYNASNLLGVLGALRALGVPLAAAAQAVAGVSEVPGRLQRLAGGGIEVVVDYAHTPDALAQVLAALRPLAAARGGRLVCLFGCGGNRDATKRPLMGGIAARGADRVVVTSDNPRDEDPAAILAQIVAGIASDGSRRDGVDVIENRAAAIAHAIEGAAPGDVVLLAGKGHEDYQEIAGVKRPFSDLAEARNALARRVPVGSAR